jgi:hypothetical protein
VLFSKYNKKNQVKEDELAGHVARMGEMKNAYRTLVGKPEGKRPLGSARRRWVDNIMMILERMGWCGLD